jgi:hypothetical protein
MPSVCKVIIAYLLVVVLDHNVVGALDRVGVDAFTHLVSTGCLHRGLLGLVGGVLIPEVLHGALVFQTVLLDGAGKVVEVLLVLLLVLLLVAIEALTHACSGKAADWLA